MPMSTVGTFIRRIRANVQRDVAAAKERDPAARSTLELVTSYPGLHAVWAHRLAHRLHKNDHRLVARWISQAARFVTGIEIHPGATIGPGLFIDHGMGVVIGETTEIGEDVTIFQGVTLGGTGKETGKRHPTLHDGVIIGTGAQVLGSIEIGEGAKVGAGSIVVKDVPPNSTVVGNPGRAVVVDGQRVDPDELHHPKLEHGRLPDPMAEAIACLVRRIGELESDLDDLRNGRVPPERAPEGDCVPTVQQEIAGIMGLNGGSGI